MPLKSKAQQRWMFAAESRGELPEGTAKKWVKHTPNIKDLPEHVKKASASMFSKIAVATMPAKPIPPAVSEQQEAQQAAGQSRKGLSPAAKRTALSAKI